MKMIPECSVKQKQVASNYLLRNNLYQPWLLAHCIIFLLRPPASLSNAFGASEQTVLPPWWIRWDPVRSSERLSPRISGLLVQPIVIMLPGMLLPCACRTTNRQGYYHLQGQGCLAFPTLHWSQRKGRWHCFGQVEERDAGWGVFIYNLGFVCTVYVSYQGISSSFFAFKVFYTTCRGTEVAMSSSCVKNVDSVSEPKSKINKAN